jgi:hypothetical protein
MATRPPTRRLKSVDLPVLGRPTMTTMAAIIPETGTKQK